MFLSWPFFKAMFKEQRSSLLKISGGFILYETLLSWVYPAIAKTPAVGEIVDTIPSTVKTVFGVSPDARTDTFEAFFSSQFLARIWTLIMAAYGITTANALLAKLIDNGSLALPLSAPLSRSQLLATQAALLFVNNAVLIGVTFGGVYGSTRFFKIKIDKTAYFKLSLLSLSFFSAVSSYAFLFATLGSKEKSLAYSYGVTALFYGLDVIAGLWDKLNWAESLSLFHLLKPQDVLEGTVKPASAIIGLAASAAALLEIAGWVFEKRDLPL
ncbi:MAG: ABC transporter permease subunit [Peptococcaceae bacterium]|nr:ABC transporter permease subunit [Peptococcaceae bacterium]